jgi:hypothetical protein
MMTMMMLLWWVVLSSVQLLLLLLFFWNVGSLLAAYCMNWMISETVVDAVAEHQQMPIPHELEWSM